MKKFRIPFVVLIVVTIAFFVFNAFGKEKVAEEKNSKPITEITEITETTLIETQTPLDKAFEFSFYKDLDKATVTENIIKVLDEEQTEVPIGVELSEDEKTIIIQAPVENYNEGTVYTLQIEEGIKYKDGDAVEETLNMDFITVRDEVENVEMNENLIFVKTEEVEVFADSEVTVEKSIKSDLAVGDILVIPTEEHPEGQALKILELEEKKGKYQLIVEEPDFAELFDELDVYKTYEIKKEHIEIEEGIEGLSVTDFAGTSLNTLLASSEGEKEKFEFRTTESLKGTESVTGIEFAFKDMPLGNDKSSLVLDGSLSFENSIVATDMRLGEETRYQISNIGTSISKFTLSPGEEGKNKEAKQTNEKIKLAKLKVPTASPGLFVKGVFYLQVDYEFSYKPEVTVIFEVEEERGVIFDGKTVRQINKFMPELDASLKGTGKVETGAGAVVGVGITAFGVTGVGVEAYGGVQGTGEFHTGVNNDFGNYSCYEASFNPVLQGTLIVDVIGKEVYKVNLAIKDMKPNIAKGNCEVFQELQVDKHQVELGEGETIGVSVNGIYANMASQESQTLELKDSKNLKAVSANEDVVIASVENNEIVIIASDAPSEESALITIEYEEESHGDTVKSLIELSVIISDFEEVAETLTEEEYLAIAKNTMGKILGILYGAQEKHSLYNSVPGIYKLVEAELSSLITDEFVDKKMKSYVETEFYCDCDSAMNPRIDDAMIRVKITVIDPKTFLMESIFLGNIHNPTRKQILEFKKEETEWKLNNWFDESLKNVDLKLSKEEVEHAYTSSQYTSVAKVIGDYFSEDSGGPAYIIELDGFDILGVDKRTGQMLLDAPFDEEAEEIEEQKEQNAGITIEEAVELVRQHLGVVNNTEIKSYYDRDNELGHYIIHVYQFILDDPSTGAGRDATYGWYGVDPQTGEVYDEIMRTLE
ncbi:Ig-like domain-containing protein [Planococcus sp. CAU13]|uniref:Ig-like domain-containing protein n=1 Tax=Planococcus sp. CAU13 TaxID=1541197 RepID=UPI00052FFDBE|nr:Ig-like domain-containing protein [Planococcus sp. CAU13]